jgi:hypothetical protein
MRCIDCHWELGREAKEILTETLNILAYQELEVKMYR